MEAVGLRCPNRWGIHNAHGGIYRWTQDYRANEFAIRGTNRDEPIMNPLGEKRKGLDTFAGCIQVGAVHFSEAISFRSVCTDFMYEQNRSDRAGVRFMKVWR